MDTFNHKASFISSKAEIFFHALQLALPRPGPGQDEGFSSPPPAVPPGLRIPVAAAAPADIAPADAPADAAEG